jgi:hypothetical protein
MKPSSYTRRKAANRNGFGMMENATTTHMEIIVCFSLPILFSKPEYEICVPNFLIEIEFML